MTIDILICTIDEGITSVPSCLMDKLDGVGYVVSFQYTDTKYLSLVPELLKSREDVFLTCLEGRGLSANRNNAIAHAKADFCIIADDDCRYTPERLEMMKDAFLRHKSADMLMFQSLGPDGELLRPYPSCSFNMHCPPKGYYPISIDLAFRRESMDDILFDTRFGLGSPFMGCGEEGVWVETAKRMGKTVLYVPQPLAQTMEIPKSGRGIFHDSKKLFGYGALSYFVYGFSAILRCLKYVVLNAPSHQVSIIGAYKGMLKGIFYIMRDGRKIDKEKMVVRKKGKKQWQI